MYFTAQRLLYFLQDPKYNPTSKAQPQPRGAQRAANSQGTWRGVCCMGTGKHIRSQLEVNATNKHLGMTELAKHDMCITLTVHCKDYM